MYENKPTEIKTIDIELFKKRVTVLKAYIMHYKSIFNVLYLVIHLYIMHYMFS